MPNQNLTQILVIQDRSGSMDAVRLPTIDGFNEFVKGQQGGPGDAKLRLVQFDHEYHVVFDKPIKEVQPLDTTTYQPRGNTALLDAMGRGILDLGRDLDATQEPDKPGKVVVVIMTDGEENASREFDRAKVFEMVTHQQAAYQWEFLFMGANQDAIKAGGSIGVKPAMAMNYAATPDSVRHIYAVACASVMRGRAGASMEVTDDERKKVFRK